MRYLWLVVAIGCGDNVHQLGTTPEQVSAGAKDGQTVVAIGTVHATTFDSLQAPQQARELARHHNSIEWVLHQDDEEIRGKHFAYDDAGAKYPRTPDHYILIRSVEPTGSTLAEAWGLGVHLTDIDPSAPMPDIGSVIKVTGTFHRIAWNQLTDEPVPIIDNATIEIVSGEPSYLGLHDACRLDQECNDRLVCDRATATCLPPPREIYWADPFHDLNGACDSDADCPGGQVCDATHAIASTGSFAAHYFADTDPGRHMCVIDPAMNTVAAQCPHIHVIRDVIGARFVTGKEICVRATLLSPVPAADGDTHDQMLVDEPLPYPTDDIAYNLFGGTTENGPPYKDPTLPGGAIVDPMPDDHVVAVGTFRYDPDHGWYEVHPVKAYFKDN